VARVALCAVAALTLGFVPLALADPDGVTPAAPAADVHARPADATADADADGTDVANANDRADATQLTAPKTEVGLLPVIGGDTDIGYGAGVIGSVAGLAPGFTPYKWKLEFAGFYATKTTPLHPSYEDSYLLLTFPELLDKRLRLEIRPSYTHESDLLYYGLGNYAPSHGGIVPARDEYTRMHPAISVDTTWLVYSPWKILVGAQYTWNKISFDPDSTLAMQMQGSDAYVRNAIAIEPEHGVLRLQTALIYDSRDNEISTYNGQYHWVKFRISPGLGDALPYQYEQIDAQARFYYTPIPHRLTLTARGVFDLQLGDPPFYELSRYEETSAIGGVQGVRGVPAYRYYGKVKAFVNLEARSEVLHFHLLGKHFLLGVAGFFDAGRLWTAIDHSPAALDGTGLGIHYGIGGGVRLQQGKTFVVRGDIAWSPDAMPVGAYVIANQIF
jgi:hypothetical protein